MADISRNNEGKTGYGNPPIGSRFTVGNPGRPKGSRNKLGEAFIDALQDDFAEHGPAVIEAVRVDKPDQYLKVIASVIPKEINHTVEDYGSLSDDDLHARFLVAVARLNRGKDDARGDRAQAEQKLLPH